MAARGMHKEDEPIKLTLSALMHSNHPLKTENVGVMRRIVPVAMNRPPAEPDLELKTRKLPAEAGKILGWIATAERVVPTWPAVIHDARRDFVFDSDPVERWLRSGAVELDEDAETLAAEALRMFNEFMAAEGRKPWSQADLTHKLRTKGFGKFKRRIGGKQPVCYKGLSLAGGAPVSAEANGFDGYEEAEAPPIPF